MRPLKALLVTSPNNQLNAVRVNVVKRALSQTSAQIDSKYAAPIISTLTLKRRRVIHCAWRAQTGGRLPEKIASGAETASKFQRSYSARGIKKKLTYAQRNLMVGNGLFLLAAPTLAAENAPQKNAANDPAHKSAQKPAHKEPLAENENPELIGKRNINKFQINFYSFDKEVAIGRQFAQEVDHSAKLVEDPIIVEYINKVGQNLVLHSDAKVPFTIKVIDADEINACALPGGFFYVNKGLIRAADNEAERAGPMAHEIAHVAARHGVEQASKGQIVNWGTLPLIFMGGWGGFAARQAASLAI